MKRTYYKTATRRRFYSEMLEQQDGKCLICGQKERLVIDYNHQTGEMRGLLCYTHNAGLGMFQDDPDMLIKAANYLLTVGHIKPVKEVDLRLVPKEHTEKALLLLQDTSFTSDRARARVLAKELDILVPAAQTRISRLRHAASRDLKNS